MTEGQALFDMMVIMVRGTVALNFIVSLFM